MKRMRIIAAAITAVLILTLSASAVHFTPSIERKDAPELVEGDDALILTPVSDIYDEETELHEDIEKNLADAEKELDEKKWEELVEEFEKIWEEVTNGAPIEHAVISDIFDIRFETELSDGDKEGREITIKIKLIGIEGDDLFVLLYKECADKPWVVLDYEIDEDGVITIKVNTKSVLAVVKDNEAPPAIDPDDPDSPQTGVSQYFVPAVLGAIFFAALAILCVKKGYSKA